VRVCQFRHSPEDLVIVTAALRPADEWIGFAAQGARSRIRARHAPADVEGVDGARR
jgi:hypothetical protein